MKNRFSPGLLSLSFVSALVVSVAMAAETVPTGDAGSFDTAAATRAFRPTRPYSPWVGAQAPRRVRFGDTHLHTSLSTDAGLFGTRLGPEQAYRLARGEEIASSSGQPVRLSRPLDFLIVTDHSDQLGLVADILAGKPEVLAEADGRRWHNMFRWAQGTRASLDLFGALEGGSLATALRHLPGTRAYRDAWQAEVETAERFDEPGRFTALIGYEWTAQPGGDDLHRTVVFRDGAERAGRMEPLTSAAAEGSDDPADLWKWMATYEQETGGSVLAIPHGGNRSNGRMFPAAEGSAGKKLDAAYAAARARWEPLYEVTQTAGDAETHPELSPDDEFAKFERWDKGNLDLLPKTQGMLAGEYARSALERGLEFEEVLGTNPYRFGFTGGSDSHTGLSTVEEDNFFGRVTADEPSQQRLRTAFATGKSGVTILDAELAAAGYTAVWSGENTRASIWDALRRRETYATTGSRMEVRFFGGWQFDRTDMQVRDFAEVGYRKGIPMGGDLGRRSPGKVPTFLVAARKDPIGGNLDRYQIVKGWIDGDGRAHERIYDVAVSGDRTIDEDGRCRKEVGDTVKYGDATWVNRIGAPELVGFWTDAEFDPSRRAFYYGRVIEIPTPRWTTYDQNRFGNDPPQGTPSRVTERAYTSPIWYSPAADEAPGKP